MSIKSHLTTLQEISKSRLVFNVPIYQRLYVWGNDQIDTLLEDLLSAYQQGNEFFYLGGALVVERQGIEGQGPCFDLIDGQQRFTTLWMMSLAWQESLAPFLGVAQEHGLRPRVSFSIRPEVDRFFVDQLRHDDSGEAGNSQLVDALAIIRSFRDERFKDVTDAAGHPLDFPDFTRFVFEKVQLVLTQVPAHTDLNKLFEVINNRGVQLQHHEILKARMLAFLSDDAGERDRYATLWDACSHMGNYVEKNLRDIGGITIATLFDNESGNRGKECMGSAEQVLAALQQHRQSLEDEDALDLEAVLARSDVPADAPPAAGADAYEAREVRSIISFPLLLQHTLRLWLARRNRPDLLRILDKELLQIFTDRFFAESADQDAVKSFVRLLWETRYAFDKHVIKWVKIDKEEQHLICRLYLNTSGGSKSLQRRRPDSNEAFALLQSMLYHSQQITTHYWLTPLLAYLLKHPAVDPLPFLRHLDNHLLTSRDGRPLAERSADFIRDENFAPPFIDIATEWDKGLGVQFPHYWFYKLEFVLWDTNHLGLTTAESNAFRITAKNSVEHISPQQAQVYDSNRVSDGFRDSFGNLALVSRSLNSEFSNKTYSEKRSKFLESNRDRIDSLKMKAIYRSPTWGDDQASKHQQEMVKVLADYLVSSVLVDPSAAPA